MHDTHAHLEMLCQNLGLIPENREGYEVSSEDRERVYQYLNQALVKHDWLIHPTVSTKNLIFTFKLFYKLPNVYFLLGSHPEIVDVNFDLEEYLIFQKQTISELADKFPDNNRNGINISKLIGIGECGLDYYYSKDPVVVLKQKELFRSQIRLALEMNLPLIVHTREAFKDTFEILDEYPEIFGKFLIHCFTGNTDDLKETLKRGGKVAFGGISTFPKALELRDSVKECPLENMVLETDLPFLAPVPFRGKTCLPEMIEEVAKTVAELKNTTPEIIWKWSEENSKKLFGSNMNQS